MDNIDNLIARWMETKKQLAIIQEEERSLRRTIFAVKFPEPKEGTNKSSLGNGWELKATYPIDRKVDMPMLQAIQDQFFDMKIPPDIIKMDPKLNIKPYRLLTAEQLKFFDQALIIKPGSISLEILPPKVKE